MCVSFGPAKFTSTIVYGQATHFKGSSVHVLGYQNAAENLVQGPNAMILPIPAAAPMGPDNAIDTREFSDVLERYRSALRARNTPRGGPVPGRAPQPAAVQVFDVGSYTVVLARNAGVRAINSALANIDPAKRPVLNPDLLTAYERWYPRWHIALCCFDGRIRKPEPLLWWYEPMQTDRVFLPGLDGHDGHLPSFEHNVRVDHTIVFGAEHVDPPPISEYRPPLELPSSVPGKLHPLFAEEIEGIADLDMLMPNGDWYIPLTEVRSELLSSFTQRFPPPGLAARR